MRKKFSVSRTSSCGSEDGVPLGKREAMRSMILDIVQCIQWKLICYMVTKSAARPEATDCQNVAMGCVMSPRERRNTPNAMNHALPAVSGIAHVIRMRAH